MKQRIIGLQLRSLNNLIMRYMRNVPARRKIDCVTGMNGWLIGYIAEHQQRAFFQKDLENHFCITRSTASKVLSLMERKGLILRRSVPGDARLKQIVLTPKAKATHKVFVEEGNHMEKILTDGFTENEIAELFSYIERMRKNMKRALK